MLRFILPIVAVLALVGALAAVKATQIKLLIHTGEVMKEAGPPPETVASAIAKTETWEETLPSVGTVAAAKGVTVSNDAPGVVSGIYFESGAAVQQGQTLVVLDSSVERAQLASAEARRELATVSAGRTRALVRSDSLPKAQLDNDEAVLKTSGADLQALQAQIDRKVVRAPFSGRLGIRSINLGQYLNPGTAITSLEAIDSVYVDFSVPQQRLAEVPVGTPVRIIIDGSSSAPLSGAIAAVDPAVDPQTRSIKLRAAVPNKELLLRPGMFVRAVVILPAQQQVVAIPATAIVHASYGDSVFIIEKGDPQGAASPRKVGQQFVRIGESRGDFVSILDGVKPGDEVVVAGAFKLRKGTSVVVDNKVDMGAKLDPRPENH